MSLLISLKKYSCTLKYPLKECKGQSSHQKITKRIHLGREYGKLFQGVTANKGYVLQRGTSPH